MRNALDRAPSIILHYQVMSGEPAGTDPVETMTHILADLGLFSTRTFGVGLYALTEKAHEYVQEQNDKRNQHE